jgi:hypothetical protein
VEPLAVDAVLFADRGYTLSELPAELKGARFLRIDMDGQKQLRCTRAGTVFFLTPAANRNRDSQAATLLEQGFHAVALPEVRLFNPVSAANFCTLYQKDCAAGDTIQLGKWALPVFFQ